jgi:hypothetical protein
MPLIDTEDKENYRPKGRRNQGRQLKRLVDRNMSTGGKTAY